MVAKYSQKVKRGNVILFFGGGGGGRGGGRGVVLVFFFMTEQQKHRPIQNAENFLKVPLDFDNFLGED